MKADYHLHTPYCGHAQGAIIEFVESAIAAGLEEIAFTDHLGRYYLGHSQRRRYWDWGMDEATVERYVREILDLQDTYQDKITIRLGLEADYIEGAEEMLERILRRYPLDCVLGSIHCIPSLGWRHLADTSIRDPRRVFQAYFSAALSAVESGLFEVLAHLDFIWRYVRLPRPDQFELGEAIEQVIKAAAQRNMAVEINANAYLWSQVYSGTDNDPFELLLDSIERNRIAVTFGSDAHAPRFVGKAFSEINAVVACKGVRRQALFRNRQIRIVDISPPPLSLPPNTTPAHT